MRQKMGWLLKTLLIPTVIVIGMIFVYRYIIDETQALAKETEKTVNTHSIKIARLEEKIIATHDTVLRIDKRQERQEDKLDLILQGLAKINGSH